MNIKEEKAAGYSKNIFMFEFPKTNLSGLDYGQFSKSPPCAINNLTWRILITKVKANDVSKGAKDSLGVYLECLAKSKLWSCLALVRFTLISQKPDVSKTISLEFKHLFSAVSVSQGYHNFIAWDRVTSTEYGYISNDTIRIQAYVEADFPKNISTLDYNSNQPESFDDWLSLFENKLNDKIVRRISEEIKTLKNEKLKGFGKLSEELKSLNKNMERVHNRGVKIMSEFMIKCLKVVMASIFRKMDSLKLDDFHNEMVSVLGELQRIKSTMISEEKANIKLADENEAKSSKESDNESDPEETGEAKLQIEKKEETSPDCEIIEDKALETITITSSSESDDEESSNINAPREESEENTVVPKHAMTKENIAASASNFFKALVTGYQQDSSKCCLPRSGRGSGASCRPQKFSAHTCLKIGPVFYRCSAEARPNCELGSQLNCTICSNKNKPKSLKRKVVNNNRSCSSTSADPPKRSKYLENNTVKDGSDGDSNDTICCLSKSPHSRSTDDETCGD